MLGCWQPAHDFPLYSANGKSLRTLRHGQVDIAFITFGRHFVVDKRRCFLSSVTSSTVLTFDKK